MLNNFCIYFQMLIKLFGIHDFLPSSALLRFLAQNVCGFTKMSEEVCSSVAFLIAGYDTSNLNETRIPVYMSHLPAGTSSKDMIHFAQVFSFFLLLLFGIS